MIQKSKIDVTFFPDVFDAMFIFGTSPTNMWSDAWHITVAFPAQNCCAQTISANVLKTWLKALRAQTLEVCEEILSTSFVLHAVENTTHTSPQWCNVTVGANIMDEQLPVDSRWHWKKIHKQKDCAHFTGYIVQTTQGNLSDCTYGGQENVSQLA